jgi:hypothetical protein
MARSAKEPGRSRISEPSPARGEGNLSPISDIFSGSNREGDNVDTHDLALAYV